MSRNQKKMKENREIQEILARSGATKEESRLIDEQIQQGDKIFAENDLQKISSQTLNRIEQTIRARLAATPTQDVNTWKESIYATTAPARPRPFTLTNTSFARRLLPLAASIIIVFAILWANFPHSNPPAAPNPTVFDDELSLLELALSRQSNPDIDEFALSEVLILWEDTNPKDQDQMIKKSLPLDNLSNRYHRINNINQLIGSSYA